MRRDIQGLRAVAITMVVLYHAGLPVPGGFTGVDVFFVVSGFVITAMLLRELDSTGTIRFRSFYARRARRLLPALAFMLVAVAVASALLLNPFSQQGAVAKTGIAAALFFSNGVLYLLTHGYFGVPIDSNPLLHTWTLAVEEQFYFAFPLITLAVWHVGSRRLWHRRQALAASFGAIALASFLLSLAMTRWLVGNPTFAFYSSPTRAWEFGAGACLAAINIQKPHRRVALAFSVIGLLLLAVAALAIHDTDRFPDIPALAPVLGTCFLIAAGSLGGGALTPWLETRLLNWIGDRSYSIYLWHWPTIVFAAVLFPVSATARAIAAVLSIAPAAFSYSYVEQPVRRRVRRSTLRLSVALVAVPIVAFIGLFGVADQLRPRPPSSAAALPCPIGELKPGSVIWVVGDSHGFALFPALSCAKAHGIRVANHSLGGCPFAYVSVAFPPAALRVNFPTIEKCAGYVRITVRRLERAHVSAVVIANRSPRYIAPFGARAGILAEAEEGDRVAIGPWGSRPTHIGTPAANLTTWRVGMARAVREIRQTGAAVVIFSTVPEHRTFAGDCGAILITVDCGPEPLRLVEQRRRRVTAIEKAIAGRASGVVDVDPYRLFCKPSGCSSFIDGSLAYSDNDHLVRFGALEMGPCVLTGIKMALGRQPHHHTLSCSPLATSK